MMIMDVFSRFRRRKADRDGPDGAAGPLPDGAEAARRAAGPEEGDGPDGAARPASVGIPKQASAAQAPDNAERPLALEPGAEAGGDEDGGRRAAGSGRGTPDDEDRP